MFNYLLWILYFFFFFLELYKLFLYMNAEILQCMNESMVESKNT